MLSVLLDKNILAHQFQSTMLKPQNRFYVRDREILSFADPYSKYGSEEQTESSNVQLVTIVKNPNNEPFKYSNKAQYEDIVMKDGIKPVFQSYLLRRPKFIGNCQVLKIKDPDTEYKSLKSRCILQGHKYSEHLNIAKNYPMLIHMMLLILISFAVILFKSRFQTHYVEKAFFQAKNLGSDMFTKPAPEEKLSPDHVLKVILPQKVIPESGS